VTFTTSSDLYGAAHEDGFNLILRHVMRQRPSWFNYGTAAVAADPKKWCRPIVPAPAVVQRANPLMAVQDPLELPLLGTPFSIGLDFCAQITGLQIDFHPGGAFNLPAELAPPLGAQRFALFGEFCMAIGCPSDRLLDHLPPLPEPRRPMTSGEQRERQPLPPIRLPGEDFECFCLRLYVVGHMELAGPSGSEKLQGFVDGLEIVDIRPEGLESAVECYLRILCRLVLLPRLSIEVSKFVFDLFDLVAVTLTPTPISAAVPNNPAVEDDQVKVFIDVTAGP
jgi:hypothetical protein